MRIPKTALYKIPDQNELFGDEFSKQSKVDDAIRRAKDRNESHIDHNVNPPLKLMKEVILDPRTQYPLRMPSSQPIDDVPLTSSKKRFAGIKQNERMTFSLSRIRSNTVEDTSAKRLCNSTDAKTNILLQTKADSVKISEIALPKVENLSVGGPPTSPRSRTFGKPLEKKNAIIMALIMIFYM